MINSINSSAQNVEAKSATIVPFKSPSDEKIKTKESEAQAEKLQAQTKNKRTPMEESQEQSEKISQKMLDELSKDIETLHSIGLSFAQHDDTGRTMVSVMDKNTEELIRQIPAEDFLDMAAKMDAMIGILFDEKV